MNRLEDFLLTFENYLLNQLQKFLDLQQIEIFLRLFPEVVENFGNLEDFEHEQNEANQENDLFAVNFLIKTFLMTL